MNKDKYYVLKNGKNPKIGIYSNYEKLLKNMNENSTYEEFNDYKSVFDSFVQCPYIDDNDKIIIYTDGSYNEHNKELTYGYIVVKNHRIIRRYYKTVIGNSSADGESRAVSAAIDYIKKQNATNNAVICCDCKDTIKRYKNKEKEVEFVKIKGHSHEPFNTYVDRMLKYKSDFGTEVGYGLFKKAYFESLIVK